MRMVARVASKVLFGVRNSSGHRHGQASPAWIETVGIFALASTSLEGR
jgi:hypothetical protein